MSVVLGIACEDDGHFSAVTRLVDDTLLANCDWLDGILEASRAWCGLSRQEPWYKYDPADARDLGPFRNAGQVIRLHGHIQGKPLKPEATMWRRVLLLFCDAEPRPDVVVLARDMDGYPNRRAGMVQVRDGLPWPFEVVLAWAEPEVEAWLVAGFAPIDRGEQTLLDDLRAKLSFDPTTQSHRLTSHRNDAPTDAKRVLDHLSGGDRERREACLADRALLRARGAANGAAAFLDEVDARIVPVFGARP
jgi:hypothetical protein